MIMGPERNACRSVLDVGVLRGCPKSEGEENVLYIKVGKRFMFAFWKHSTER